MNISRKVKFEVDQTQKVQSQEPKRDFIKFDIKNCLQNMIKAHHEYSQRSIHKFKDSIKRSIKKSDSHSKSIPRPEELKNQPQNLNINIVDQKPNKSILKSSKSMKMISSGNFY